MIKPIFYITLDPEKALGIEDLLLNYHILYGEPSQLTLPISYAGVNIFNIPRESGLKSYKTSDMLKSDKLYEYTKKWLLRDADIPNIIVFKSDKLIEQISYQKGYKLLNPFYTIIKEVENKLHAADIFNTLNISQPRYLIASKLSGISYSYIIDKLGHSFVIQFPLGHSGNSTFFVSSKEEFESIKRLYPNRASKISELIEGPTYTANGIVSKMGIIVAGISEQITGIKGLTSSKGGTVGNDLAQRHLDDNLRVEIIKIVQKVGNFLASKNFKGMFGVDLLLDVKDKKFYILEINARQVASASFISYLQRLNKIVPVMLWHILELIDYDYSQRLELFNEDEEEWINNRIKEFMNKEDKISYMVEINQPVLASQVFFRNTNDYPIQIIEQFPLGAYRIRGRMPNEASSIEGNSQYLCVYPLREDALSTLCLERKAYKITEVRDKSTFLIFTKSEKCVVEPLGEIGRIQILDSVFGNDSDYYPNGWVMDVINAVYENISFIKFCG